MWRHDDNIKNGILDKSGFIKNANGLFPAVDLSPNEDVLELYTSLGRLMARCLLDQRILDMDISPILWKMMLDKNNNKESLKLVDRVLYNSLQAILNTDADGFEHLCLDFTLPGNSSVELIPGGADIPVTKNNVADYIDNVVRIVLHEGVYRQVQCIKRGFSETFPVQKLRVFDPEEINCLICGQSQQRDGMLNNKRSTNTTTTAWSRNELLSVINPDHGYTIGSQTVQFLIDILLEFDLRQKRHFLQFLTGSPRLPVNGIRGLGSITVVRKVVDDDRHDLYLPSVMTCVTYLKLPDYSSKNIMREKLMLAMYEGGLSFHLS